MSFFAREKDGEQVGEKRPPIFLKVRSSKWFILTVIGTAIFTDLFLYGVIVPVIPFALHTRVGVALGNVQHWVSVMLAVYAAGLLAFSPVWGWYADHTSSRGPPFLMGLFALVGATALLCVGNSIPIIVVGRLLQGISAALVWTVGMAIVSDTVGKDQVGEAMGWVMLGIGIAIFAGPMLGGIVFAHGGYYAVFIMTFGLVALDIVMRLLMIEAKVAKKYLPSENATSDMSTSGNEPKHPPQANNAAETDGEEDFGLRAKKRGHPTILVLLRCPRLLSGLWGCLVVALLLCSFDSVLPLYVHKIFAWDATGAGLIFLPICLPSFLEPLIGRLGDRFGVRWVVVGGFASALPFYILLRFVTYDSLPQKVLLCTLLFLIGLSVSCVMPPLLAEVTLIVTDLEKEEPGVFGDKSAFAQAYALFNMAYAGGTLTGPLWAGFVNQTAGWGAMAWSLGLLSAVTAVPMAIWTGGSLLKKERRKGAVEEEERAERRPMSEGEVEA